MGMGGGEEREKRISHESVSVEVVTHCRARFACSAEWVSGALYF